MGNVNLVTNPSFESNLTGWTFVNATATMDGTVTGGSGNFSCKLVSTASGAPMVASYVVSGLTIGKSYTVSSFIRTSPAADPFTVVMSVDADSFPGPTVSGQNYFQRRQFGFVATNTSATVRIQTSTDTDLGDVLWIDRVQVNEGPLLPYFDGDYPYSYWTGTQQASTSVCTAFDSAVIGNPTTDEVVVVNGLCLNTVAWSVTTKNGRYNPAPVRGEDLTFPGSDGKTFVPNKPIDSGLWTLSMFLLGQNVDGTVPIGGGMRAAFDYNYGLLLRQVLNNQSPVTIYAWQPDGTVRTTQATLIGASPEPAVNMGGRRAEFSLTFDILSGLWEDYIPTTISGTPSAAWSAQTLSLDNLSSGSAPINDSTIVVAGPITNPKVTNNDTGTWVQYTGTVGNGSYWTINCDTWSSTVGASSVLANTTHGGHARFVVIGPGDMFNPPSLTLTGSGTTAATNLSVTATRKHWFA